MKEAKIRYIVCYMFKKLIRKNNPYARISLPSDYECFETLKEARFRYKELCDKSDLYSASIAKIIESTDY